MENIQKYTEEDMFAAFKAGYVFWANHTMFFEDQEKASFKEMIMNRPINKQPAASNNEFKATKAP